jgi:hypothetical protein
MRNLLFIIILTLLVSCSSSDDNNDRLMYDVTYTVTASNGAIINKVEYRDSQGDLIELTDITTPWTINLNVRAGQGLEAAAFGNIPFGGSLSITAVWVPEGGSSQSETDTLGNTTPDSTINNARVDIPGRTLPD